MVVPSKPMAPSAQPTGGKPEEPEPSWWTTRATSGVEAGFTRDEILAEVPPDPSGPGGLFERLRQVLTQLSGPTLPV
jgi:hypothetical protein